MNVMRFFPVLWFILAGLAAAAPLPEASPDSVGISSERLKRLDATLQKIIDDKELPGMTVMIARKGNVVYQKSFGFQDREQAVPMTNESIFRIYSMTKPIVSVAAMMLVEEGKLNLAEPISKYIPEFKNMQVGIDSVDANGNASFSTVAAKRQITVQDLLRHTSGLTYGAPLNDKTTVQKMYKEAGIGLSAESLGDFVKALAKLPLAYEPGSTYEYSHSTDVLGRVVEVASGKSLDEFLRERILVPLKMRDTLFILPSNKLNRLAEPQPNQETGAKLELLDFTKPTRFFAGGHGLVSTAGDYLRFCQMLLNRGELEGARILGPRTVAYMASNHVGPAIGVGTVWNPGNGYGFGLGFAVRKEAGLAEWPGSVGDYFWGGYAGTYFWIDPKEQLTVTYMSQEVNRRNHYRMLVRDLVYQSLID
ncbi:MAG: serine hydrolase domain-containing protein [Burkholderiales bacterium]